MSSKMIKPHSDYIWFQESVYDKKVYVHVTFENKKYVRYFHDDNLSPSLVRREEIDVPRNIKSLSSIMQSTYFEFMMHSLLRDI